MRNSIRWMALLAAMLLSLSLGCEPVGTEGQGPNEQSPQAHYSMRPPPQVDLAFSVGKTVYVPVYSQVHAWSGEQVFNFAANVAIRNTDANNSITLTSVRYYDNDGNMLGEYLDAVEVIPPLGTRTYYVTESDRDGGLGANMMVDWRAEQSVSEPIIEAVMVHVSGTYAVGFTSEGRVVEVHSEAELE